MTKRAHRVSKQQCVVLPDIVDDDGHADLIMGGETEAELLYLPGSSPLASLGPHPLDSASIVDDDEFEEEDSRDEWNNFDLLRLMAGDAGVLVSRSKARNEAKLLMWKNPTTV